jgi:hypothetical protein
VRNKPSSKAREHWGSIHGIRRRAIIDPGEFDCSVLASELADLWLAHVDSSDLSLPSASGIATAVKSLCRFVDQQPSASRSSLYGGPLDLLEIIYRWRSVNSSTRAGYAQSLQRLIRRAYQGERPLQTGLSEFATGASVPRPTTINPLDEFSHQESVVQRRAATNDIALAESRLKAGVALYETSYSFRELVAFARTGPGFSVIRNRLFGDAALLARVEAALGHAVPNNAVQAVRQIGSLLALRHYEALSFQVLLQWATGFSPEQITDTKISDLEFRDGSMIWTTYKARASKLMTPTFEDPTSFEDWGTVGLFRRAVDSGELVRRLTERPNDLWLVYTVGTRQKGLLLDTLPIQKPNFAGWLHHHGLTATLPHDRRRIRKTVKSVRTGISGSAALAAAPDQSLSTFEKHYLPVTTSISAAARTIVRAQNRIFARIIDRSPMIWNSSAAAALADGAIEEQLVSVVSSIADEDAIERSLRTTACANPTDSPFAPPGEMCLERPFACLRCPNAVIFSDHLPQILSMSDFVESQKTALPPLEYLAHWGDDRERIDEIVGAFDADTVEHARAAVDANRERLHLPFSIRTANTA